MKNRVTELLGCRYPVIQGAMGVICNPEFVAAVSEAGGFGLLATAFAEGDDVVREQIRATKKLTDKPFGLNLFVMNPLIILLLEPMLIIERLYALTGGAPGPHDVLVLRIVSGALIAGGLCWVLRLGLRLRAGRTGLFAAAGQKHKNQQNT